MKRSINTNKIKTNKLVLFTFLFLVLVIIIRAVTMTTSSYIDGTNIKEFKNARNTQKEVVEAMRGNIYDVNGSVLATNILSYNLVAYLDDSRSKNQKKPMHVVDKEYTATVLSKYIKMSKDDILKTLKKDLYQVEFGTSGRNISRLDKEKIEAENLPGIDFIPVMKRYYPNEVFAPYVLGYAVNKSTETTTNNIVGEMGIEKQYNDLLTGKDGYVIYQKDLYGYKIPNTNEIKKDAVNGNDVYLTLDTNIQIFVEKALRDAASKYKTDGMMAVVADAKTGAILASSANPSFNPNLRDMVNYYDPMVTQYEPGSIMKIYTYMSIMEKNMYNGTTKFKSGKIEIDDYTIKDWNNTGWGEITYDQGFALSSNLGVIDMLEKNSNKEELRDFFLKLRFGAKTDIGLPNEQSGKIEFKYRTEFVTAGFGQGITTTAIQQIQAFTSLTNDGVMLKPYIVKKIVDKDTNNIILENSRAELEKVASKETVNQLKQLMYNVINGDVGQSTGRAYKIEGIDLIGKTGTAQMVGTDGKYLKDEYNRSFIGMFPMDDPKIIIYAYTKNDRDENKALVDIVRNIVTNTDKYLTIADSVVEEKTDKMPNYINMTVSDISNSKAIILGSGDTIVNQYPNYNDTLNTNSRVFLITNSSDYKFPDIKGYSLKDITILCDLLRIKCNINGNGYVYKTDILENTLVNSESVVNIDLKYSNTE